MNKKKIQQIFIEHNIEEAKTIEKIEIGFTNKIYSINNRYIIKVCENKDNEKMFEREVFFYNFFKDKISIPKIMVFDTSKRIYDKIFMIYPKIQGDNLYAKWHIINNNEREFIIKELCENLKIINNEPYENFIKEFKLNADVDWRKTIINKINHSLKEIEEIKLLP